MAERVWVFERDDYAIGVEDCPGAPRGWELVFKIGLDGPELPFDEQELDRLLVDIDEAAAIADGAFRLRNFQLLSEQQLQNAPPRPPAPDAPWADVISWSRKSLGLDLQTRGPNRHEVADFGEALYGFDWIGPLAAALKIQKVVLEAAIAQPGRFPEHLRRGLAKVARIHSEAAARKIARLSKWLDVPDAPT